MNSQPRRSKALCKLGEENHCKRLSLLALAKSLSLAQNEQRKKNTSEEKNPASQNGIVSCETTAKPRSIDREHSRVKVCLNSLVLGPGFSGTNENA